MMVKNEVPTLTKVLGDAILASNLDLRVCLPARVEKYSAELQKVNVQPLLKQVKISSNIAVRMPQITNVPVVFPSANGGNSYITLPITVGDLGFVVFCDRSIGDYLAGSGQEVAPKHMRNHDLSDGMFIPGGRPFGAALAGVDATNILIKNKNLKITIDPLGKISIENIASSAELLTIIDSMINNLLSADFVVSPPIGEIATHTHTILQPQLAINLSVDKTSLETLKRL